MVFFWLILKSIMILSVGFRRLRFLGKNKFLAVVYLMARIVFFASIAFLLSSFFALFLFFISFLIQIYYLGLTFPKKKIKKNQTDI